MISILNIEYPDLPYLNLAFEEAIAISVGKEIVPETLRFWRNNNAVVIGRFQCPTLEVNFEHCREHGVRVERRFTGGGAVFHDLGNLNFALSMKRVNPLIGERLLRGFELIGKAVEIGLKTTGIHNALFKPINSVIIGNNKVAGMAGLITKEFIFVHGSILVNSDLETLKRVLKSSDYNPNEKFVQSKRQKVTAVERELERRIELKEIKRAIKKGLEEVLGCEFEERDLTDYEKRLAEKLYIKKYSKLEWSLGPCISCPRRKNDERIYRELTLSKKRQIGKLFQRRM